MEKSILVIVNGQTSRVFFSVNGRVGSAIYMMFGVSPQQEMPFLHPNLISFFLSMMYMKMDPFSLHHTVQLYFLMGTPTPELH